MKRKNSSTILQKGKHMIEIHQPSKHNEHNDFTGEPNWEKPLHYFALI